MARTRSSRPVCRRLDTRRRCSSKARDSAARSYRRLARSVPGTGRSGAGRGHTHTVCWVSTLERRGGAGRWLLPLLVGRGRRGDQTRYSRPAGIDEPAYAAASLSNIHSRQRTRPWHGNVHINTETVFALGAGDRLVAVDNYSDSPAEAQQVQPRLNTYPTLSIETVVSLKPDLVLALVEKDDVVAQLRQQGVPVLTLFPRAFDATTREITMLGQVLGAPERGAALAAEMQARRAAVEEAVAGAERPTLFYEMDASDPARPFAAGPNGFYGQLVELAGATNVFNDLPGDFAQVSAESIIARDPQLIILSDGYAPYSPQTPAMVAARPGWDQITAVQHGAVYAVQADLFSRPGPRLADGLESLAYLVHPDRFVGSSGPCLSATPTGLPSCGPSRVPTFTFGFAALADALGATMGQPTECAHADVATGDIYQQTTKGLAVYRQASNTPGFASGGGRWVLTPDGLVADAPAAGQP
ncbi:MAG: ABC transporter substrate-binding protein [Acidimicrobiales bacterium]